MRLRNGDLADAVVRPTITPGRKPPARVVGIVRLTVRAKPNGIQLRSVIVASGLYFWPTRRGLGPAELLQVHVVWLRSSCRPYQKRHPAVALGGLERKEHFLLEG